MNNLKITILATIFLIVFSCKKENKNIQTINKLALEDLEDSSSWKITESITIITLDSFDLRIIDTVFETYKHTSIIKKTDNTDQFTISNFEHYYPTPLYNSLESTNDIIDKAYYFTKTNEKVGEYVYQFWIDFVTESVNYTTITFNDSINPTSFTANGSGSFTTLYASKMFLFTIVGTKL